MHVRKATSLDRDAIREIYLSAFPDGEKELVLKVAIDLLSENRTPQTIALVAEIDGAIVGHTAFSPVKIDNNADLQGYILAPLAVMPAYQKQGIGTALIENGIQTLAKMDVNILFVYGDPEYYGRFGFRTENAEKFLPHYQLQYPFGWQAIILDEFAIENANSRITCVDSLNVPKLW